MGKIHWEIARNVALFIKFDSEDTIYMLFEKIAMYFILVLRGDITKHLLHPKTT